ncbi:hypothetical protein LXA43DRAFT_1100991 [Ganoderma leucocontextum]|nr:hypothetical protein LXA43DRAFT_1100991 [Ganoderma leucocontextum]
MATSSKKRKRSNISQAASPAPEENNQSTPQEPAEIDWLALMGGVLIFPTTLSDPAAAHATHPAPMSSGSIPDAARSAPVSIPVTRTGAPSGIHSHSGTEVPSGTGQSSSPAGRAQTASIKGRAHPVPFRAVEATFPLFHGPIPDYLPTSSSTPGTSNIANQAVIQDHTLSTHGAQEFGEPGIRKDEMALREKGDTEEEITWQKKHGRWDGMPLDEKLLSIGQKVLKADSRRVSFARQSSQAMENIMALAASLDLHLDVASCAKWTDYNSGLVKIGDECHEDPVGIE